LYNGERKREREKRERKRQIYLKILLYGFWFHCYGTHSLPSFASCHMHLSLAEMAGMEVVTISWSCNWERDTQAKKYSY
jgi:hypothetical protein